MTPEQIVVLANVISFIGNALFTASALFKTKKRIIGFQTSCHLINSVAAVIDSNVHPSAWSGFSQDAACFFKNIVLLFVDDTKKVLKLVVNIFFIILALASGIILNLTIGGATWYGYLPVGGMFFYSVAATYVFWKEDLSKYKVEILLKSLLIVNGICQCIFGIMVQLYPNTIFNSVTIILSIYSIIRAIIAMKKEKQKEELEDEMINA